MVEALDLSSDRLLMMMMMMMSYCTLLNTRLSTPGRKCEMRPTFGNKLRTTNGGVLAAMQLRIFWSSRLLNRCLRTALDACDWLASRPGRFNPGEKEPLVLTGCPYYLYRRFAKQIACPCRESNHDPSVVQPVAQSLLH